ncbi:MAG: hypothetical protein WKF97_05260 [Chitinophagaceae bacterium]
MLKNILTPLAFLPLFVFAQQPVPIIPQPVQLQVKEGSFTIDDNTTIVFSKGDKDLLVASLVSVVLYQGYQRHEPAAEYNKAKTSGIETGEAAGTGRRRI